METLLSVAGGPFTMNDSLNAFQKYLAAISVYRDINTTRDSDLRKPAIAAVEQQASADGQNLISVLHTLYTSDRDFKRELNDAMRAAFGQDYEEIIFPPAADQRIQLRIRWRSLVREQSAAEISDGTLQFLFLIAVLGSTSLPPLIAIDEPEVGLHSSMLPVIADYARAASKRTQIILTTHSPAFLDAFGSDPPQVTVVQWPEGKTSLTVQSGQRLAHWLETYSLGDLHRSGLLED